MFARAGAMVALVCVVSCVEPASLPLPSECVGILVSPPDEDGLVLVGSHLYCGDAGLGLAGEEMVVTNLSTGEAWTVPLGDDVGFEALVPAAPGDVLAVRRRVGGALSLPIELVVPGPDDAG